MFSGEGVHKVIIVCDAKMKVYANQLSQLIASKDDKEEVVGSKDGTVEASVWEEKFFLANEPGLSSNTNIIFIGETKSAKAVIPNITEKFNNYGIHYGWMGNRAALYVEKSMLKKDDYDSFIKYCKGKQKEFAEKAKANLINSAHPIFKWVGLSSPIFTPVAIYGLIFGNIVDKKIKDQQYKFAVFNFYMEHLVKFLEE